MATLTYTREQIIALWREDLPLPKDFCAITNGFVSDRPHTPWLCSEHGTRSYKHSADASTKIKVKADIPSRPGISKTEGKKTVKDRFAKATKDTASAKVSAAPAVQPTVVAPVAWYYLDSTDNVQGPFATEKLREWWVQGLFPVDLRISLENDPSQFQDISVYFPDTSLAFSYNPRLFPFMGPVTPTPNDPLEEIYLDFVSKLARQ